MNGRFFNGSSTRAAILTGIALSACQPRPQSTIDTTAASVAVGDSASTMPGSPPGMQTPPAPNARMQQVLDQLAALGPKPIETLTPAEARKQPTPTDAVKALLQKEGKPTTPPPGITTVDRTIPGPGGALPVRIYTPQGSGAPFPVIVYYHGGGFVIANKDVYDAGPRALSKLANAVVVSVDYRLAPEHKFPAAHDDAMATYKWARANASSIKGDPARVAVAGESAGGNLAITTAIAARDGGMPIPSHVLAVYPVAGTDTTTASYRENANAKPLNMAMMGWFVKHYTRSPADLQDPRLNVVGADLHGLPPTTIVSAQIDPLRSEGEQLAEKLKGAGVDVERKNYDGAAHEFFGMDAVLPQAGEAQQFAADRLKKSFDK